MTPFRASANHLLCTVWVYQLVAAPCLPQQHSQLSTQAAKPVRHLASGLARQSLLPSLVLLIAAAFLVLAGLVDRTRPLLIAQGGVVSRGAGCAPPCDRVLRRAVLHKRWRWCKRVLLGCRALLLLLHRWRINGVLLRLLLLPEVRVRRRRREGVGLLLKG